MIGASSCFPFQVCENVCLNVAWEKNHSVEINISGFSFLVNKCESSSAEANLSEMLATVFFFFPFSPCSGKEVV